MWTTAAVWFVSAATFFGVLAAVRASRGGRRTSFRWKAAIVLAVIAGVAPAFVFELWNHQEVEVPANINASIPLPR